MYDVAIIGVGLHPFGRFGPKPAMQMGAEAIVTALDDAGIGWGDIQFGVGGSLEVSNPDAVTRLVGLTGIPFVDVFNACATAATAIQLCAETIQMGKYDIGIAVGMDKHPRGAFTDAPSVLGLPDWYAENGQFLTTKFFGMKANRYMHDHGISVETLAKVAAKNYRNGSLNPNAFRRTPSRHGGAFHVDARVSPGDRDPDPPVRCLRGAQHVRPDRRRRLADRVRVPGCV
jgi:acetyl-CoA acetyltransferase